MAHDYCGKTGSRPHFTKYPEKLRHGNMDRTVAGPARAQDLDGKQITDPKQTSDYVWYAIQRRVLSYLRAAEGSGSHTARGDGLFVWWHVDVESCH
jgi:hypothetical protein